MTNDPNTPQHAAPDDEPLAPVLTDGPGDDTLAHQTAATAPAAADSAPAHTVVLDPALADAPDVVQNKPGTVAKALIMLGVAAVLAFRASIASTGGHLLPSTMAQAIGVALLAVFVYPTPLASTKIFKSAKAYVIAGVPVVSAVVPFIAQYVDTGAWHNLTPGQWSNVIVAVIGAVAAVTTPNAEGYDQREAKAVAKAQQQLGYRDAA